MQAYGFGFLLGLNSYNLRNVAPFWPVKDISNKEIPKQKDLLSRCGQVFSRVHPTYTDAVFLDSSANKYVLVDGEVRQNGWQNAGYPAITKVTKYGNVAYSHLYVQESWNRWSYSTIAYQLISYDAKSGIGQVQQGLAGYRYFYSLPGSMDQTTLDSFIAKYSFTPRWETPYMACSTVLANCALPKQSDLDRDAGIILSEYEHAVAFDGFYSPFFITGSQQAYTLAAQQLPQIASNAIANVADIISGLAGVLRGDFSSLLKSGKTASDAWLTYRYGVSTTLMDVAEYKKYFSRIETITDDLARQTVTSRGVFTRDGWTFRCSMELKVVDLLPTDLRSQIKNLGFELSALNAWDMVPFSFIADWFLPIGDTIAAFESKAEAMTWKPTQCWFSVASPSGKHYLRCPGKWQAAMPVGHSSEITDKTFWFRIADTIALLKG